jgi:hypothetical protein
MDELPGFEAPAVAVGTGNPPLTLDALLDGAKKFAEVESSHSEPSMYGATDGKRIGTYIEQKFRNDLAERYSYTLGNAAIGIDFPELGVDVKVTRSTQPQSSSPFRSPRQKIFGLGYHLLVFVYDKTDDHGSQTAILNMLHVVFVDKARTADYQMTRAIRAMLETGCNEEDLIGYMNDRNLPVDDIEATAIARELLASPPAEGYLTISNALQWRLQYGHAITAAGKAEGVLRLR